MTSSFAHAGFKGLIGAARRDITPPAGIYSRMWGAAKHDVAAGVHRPLTMTVLTLQAADEKPLVLAAIDLGWWRTISDERFFREGLLNALSLPAANVMINLAHTHAGPSLSSEETELQGGEHIKPYQHSLRDALIEATREALDKKQPAALDWNHGHCNLACNRDLPDPAKPRVVTGFNPGKPADTTLLLGRVCDLSGRVIATLINYACHPVTLAWENNLISPDYVGAAREVVEANTRGAPCLFFQGASGDQAPRDQYTGDERVADQNGRQLGFAALSVLNNMLPAHTRLDYAGVVESGAPLATWHPAKHSHSAVLEARFQEIKLPLKQLPTVAELDVALAACSDRVTAERLRRKRSLRRGLGDAPVASMPAWVWRVGDAFIAGQPNEAYALMQTELRRQFAPHPVMIMNLVNGSFGYLPPAELFDLDLYTVWQTPFERGCLEKTMQTISGMIDTLKTTPAKG
jgi:hypothetical protein